MASQDVLNALESLAYERDRQEFALGDTLDVKTGLTMVALTFLAIQSGELIKANMSLAQCLVQICSISTLILGGALAVAELWPRDYKREPPPATYKKWILDTEAYRETYPDADPVTAEKLTEARVANAIESVQANLAINKQKSRLSFWAFGCVAVAFAANIATLIIRLF
jgi:hypothetical protein